MVTNIARLVCVGLAQACPNKTVGESNINIFKLIETHYKNPGRAPVLGSISYKYHT